MALIRVKNLLDINAAFTFTSVAGTAAQTAIQVKNTDVLTANWAVQFGATGEAQTEIKLISSISGGTAITLSAGLTYPQPQDRTLYAIKFDKIIFKRSTAGTAGTATAMTNGTVSIMADSEFTFFDDTTSASTYAYKACFYNSITTDVSSDSDWITPAGVSFYSLASLRERTKRKLFSAGYIKDDSIIDDWINEWVEKMTNTAVDLNQDYLLGTVNVAFGTSSFGSLGTITSSNFKELRRVWFTTNGNDYFEAGKKHINDYQPNETFNETHPYYFMLGDNVIGKLPSTAGTALVVYYSLPTVLTNDTDELPVSMRGYTKSCVDYALANAYYLDTKLADGDRRMAAADAELERFRQELASRSKTGPTAINIVNPIDGEDTYFIDFF